MDLIVERIPECPLGEMLHSRSESGVFFSQWGAQNLAPYALTATDVSAAVIIDQSSSLESITERNQHKVLSML